MIWKTRKIIFISHSHFAFVRIIISKERITHSAAIFQRNNNWIMYLNNFIFSTKTKNTYHIYFNTISLIDNNLLIFIVRRFKVLLFHCDFYNSTIRFDEKIKIFFRKNNNKFHWFNLCSNELIRYIVYTHSTKWANELKESRIIIAAFLLREEKNVKYSN